jgi:small-conductance mechanosensitive channel
MEEVKNITYQPKTNDCIVCGAKFVYKRQSMKYCSNACKCKAYQIRQTNNQSIKRLNKMPGIYGSRTKQKIVPAQTTKDTSSIIEQQRQTINQQKAYIEHLHKQAEQFVQMVTHETNKQVRDAIEQANKALAMYKDIAKEYYAAKDEISALKKQLRSNRDQMIGNIGAAIIGNLKK